MSTTSPFVCVPFNPRWQTHDKLDLKAIYRRPRYVRDRYGDEQRETDAQGVPTWDLTAPLPVKHHANFEAKGFEYVTLASNADLREAARNNTLIGRPEDYQNHRNGGCWNAQLYLDTSRQQDARDFAELADLVYRLGSETVEAIRRQQHAAFALPVSLRGIAAGTSRPSAVPVPETPVSTPAALGLPDRQVPVMPAKRGRGRPRRTPAPDAPVLA